jgi:hypothetical protein
MDGTYIFKVSLNRSVWRRIKLSSDHTLLDLHDSIQSAYGFDNDHLYCFCLDGKIRSKMRISSPNVDEVSIGDLELFPGQVILYLFDYGDVWSFRVKLEEIRTEGTKPGEPEIIDSRGESPEQYGSYED